MTQAELNLILAAHLQGISSAAWWFAAFMGMWIVVAFFAHEVGSGALAIIAILLLLSAFGGSTLILLTANGFF